jgi:hypothetical protein
MKKKTAARLMLFIHLAFAGLSIVRWAGAGRQVALVSGVEGVSVADYFLTILIATWTAFVISFLFYCFSKFSAVMAISFLSMLYYFWA